MPNATVDCGTHGTHPGAVVCRHLVEAKDRVVGFVENSSEPDDLQAWCDACEAMFERRTPACHAPWSAKPRLRWTSAGGRCSEGYSAGPSRRGSSSTRSRCCAPR